MSNVKYLKTYLRFQKKKLTFAYIYKISTTMKKIIKCYFVFTMLAALMGNGYAQNPYLPLWEYIPDGEPYIFEDPDRPGEMRVYVYGSHDNLRTEYCGLDQVVWSAPVNDLSRWRYDGIVFESKTDANGQLLRPDGKGDLLYAPDVAERVDANGKKTYYLYPNNQAGGRKNMVACSDRPDGPFHVCNWSKDNPQETDGPLNFDPGVFIDNDGRVYGYWGFRDSWGAELDPQTMATVKPGTEVVKDIIPGVGQNPYGIGSETVFRFFEASSIRKIKDKYVFIYSRWTNNGEFGLHGSSYTLAYAYSDHPLGPFTYGGTIIDGRGRDTDEQGKVIYTATPGGNTHGSILEINGQWYVFYHRQCGTNQFSRQAMVAPISVNVEEGPGGKVTISEGEYTSEGFAINGLDPFQCYSAGIACWYTGPEGCIDRFPNYIFSGSYPQPLRPDVKADTPEPYALTINHNPVVNNTNGSVVGYKYFNFSRIEKQKHLSLLLTLVPKGISGRIDVMVDSPWTSKGGIVLGSIDLSADMPQQMSKLRIPLKVKRRLNGKHALFLRFTSDTPAQSLCDLHYLTFEN